MYNSHMIRSFNARNNFSTAIDLARFPAINAQSAASTVSGRYGFIPTTRALAVLNDYGWFPVQATEANTRKEALEGFQKHSIRLSNPQYLAEMGKVGATIPQIILTNSHGGSSAFDLSLGLFEQICANGLIVSRGDMKDLRVRHVGYADQHMEDALRALLPEIEPTLAMTDQFKRINLSQAERVAFAAAAIELRWNGEEFAVNPQTMMIPTRSAERATESALWTNYNVVQEKIINGGVNQRDVRNGSRTFGRNRRSRAVNGLDENIKLNRALWRLTEEMAKIKAAQ